MTNEEEEYLRTFATATEILERKQVVKDLDEIRRIAIRNEDASYIVTLVDNIFSATPLALFGEVVPEDQGGQVYRRAPFGTFKGCPADQNTKGSFSPHKYDTTINGLVFCVLCGHVLRESPETTPTPGPIQ